MDFKNEEIGNVFPIGGTTFPILSGQKRRGSKIEMRKNNQKT